MDRLARISLAGVTALAVAGVAYAAGSRTHRLDVALPDGGVAHIEYSGDVAPKVTVSSAAAPGPASAIDWPVFDAAPFALFDRIAADMDRQMQAAMARANAVAAQPFAHLDQASLAGLPAGTVQYSFVSTRGGKDLCSRSLQVTSTGAGQPPKVVQQVSGDCDALKDAQRKPVLAVTRAAPVAPETRTTI